MCGNFYLDQRPAFIAPLGLRPYPPRSAARSSNGVCPPQEEALILRAIPGSRPTNHDSQVMNHAPRLTDHQSLLTDHALLIASREILNIRLICSQQTRKLFLIATFYGCWGPAPRFSAHHSEHINRAFLTGCAAIKNRRNAMKTNGGIPF
jgi:hypothetical protein